MRIILVEDYETIRECIADALREAGMETGTAATAEDAVAEISREGMPDLLITDINLGPGMDGIALAKIAHSRSTRVKVLYISGRYSEVIDMADEDQFLRKPFRLNELVGKVVEMMPSKEARAA